jgi:tetratricopeptide (TPR) repeat protein
MNRDVVENVAAFLDITVEELLERHENYLQYQLARWSQVSPSNEAGFAEYYNDNLYLYELINTPSFGIIRLIEPLITPGSTILDFGSGIGTHGLHFLGRGHSLTFVDIPSPHFDYIRWYTDRHGLTASFVEKSVAAVLPDNSFDAIFCFDVLEHVIDWRETIQFFSRILKSEGKLFLIVSFREFEGHALHISSKTGLTKEAFLECMKQNGFVEIFHRDRPVPLTHPLEPLNVYARNRWETVSKMADLFDEGQRYFLQGDLVNARRCFETVVNWNPSDFSALRALAKISLAEGRLQNAFDQAQKSLELLPDDVESMELIADIELRSGNLHAAAVRYAAVVATWPTLGNHSKRQLARLFDQGILIASICGSMTNWRQLRSLLEFLLDCHRFLEAKELAKHLTVHHPPESYSGCYVWKEYARLKRESGNYPEAITILERLATLHPQRLWIHFELSLCRSAYGDTDGAFAELELEEHLSPFRSSILVERGLIWRRLGDLQRSMSCMLEAATLMPENSRAYLEYALILKELRRYKEAIINMDKALELIPYDTSVPYELNGRAYFEYALILKELKRYKEAIICMDRALELIPYDACVAYELGVIYRLDRQYVRAVEYFELAYQVSPETIWPLFSIKLKALLTLRWALSKLCGQFRRLNGRSQMSGHRLPEPNGK